MRTMGCPFESQWFLALMTDQQLDDEQRLARAAAIHPKVAPHSLGSWISEWHKRFGPRFAPVWKALEATPEDAERIIACIDEPEALHLLAENFNWEDVLGRLPPIIRHPRCDLGTALLVLWSLGPNQYESLDDRDHPEVAIMREIIDRHRAGDYRTRAIPFDACAHWMVPSISELQMTAEIIEAVPPDMYASGPGTGPSPRP